MLKLVCIFIAANASLSEGSFDKGKRRRREKTAQDRENERKQPKLDRTREHAQQ